MVKRVLVPTDGSPLSDTALEFAVDEYPEAEIVVLHVINPVDAGYATDMSGMDYWDGWYENAKERAEEIFADIEALELDANRTIETATETGSPARSIVEYAEEHGIDHIVMGSHGRKGVERILIGSVAETVVRRSPVPVTIVR